MDGGHEEDAPPVVVPACCVCGPEEDALPDAEQLDRGKEESVLSDVRSEETAPRDAGLKEDLSLDVGLDVELLDVGLDKDVLPDADLGTLVATGFNTPVPRDAATDVNAGGSLSQKELTSVSASVSGETTRTDA